MIEYRTGDLLKQTDLDYLVHGANSMCQMNSGIAAAIRAKWPQVYQADQQTVPGNAKKLGTYTEAAVKLDNDKEAFVINLYQQYRYGPDKRQLNYEAFYRGMETLKRDIAASDPHCHIVIGIPFNIGCSLAGGSWKVVEAMLEVLFEHEPLIKLVIVKLP